MYRTLRGRAQYLALLRRGFTHPFAKVEVPVTDTRHDAPPLVGMSGVVLR